MDENTLFYLAWIIIMPLVGYQIGAMRGREAAGAAWGLFAGFIGWAVVFFGPDLRPKCPECAGVVEHGKYECKHCGTDIDPLPLNI